MILCINQIFVNFEEKKLNKHPSPQHSKINGRLILYFRLDFRSAAGRFYSMHPVVSTKGTVASRTTTGTSKSTNSETSNRGDLKKNKGWIKLCDKYDIYDYKD